MSLTTPHLPKLRIPTYMLTMCVEFCFKLNGERLLFGNNKYKKQNYYYC